MVGRAKRRDRRMARAARRERQFKDSVQCEKASESREGLSSDLLENPKSVATDLALVKKSLRWERRSEDRNAIVIDRLVGLVKKTGVPRLTKDGDLIIDEEVADKNALVASSILVSIEAQQQKDEHLERRLSAQKPQKPQTTINVGVNVDNRMDERRSRTRALIERAGAERGIQLTPSGGSAIVVSGDGSA